MQEERIQAWLSLQCGMLSGTLRGLVLWRDETGAFRVSGRWPLDAAPTKSLSNAAAAATRRDVCSVDPLPNTACPADRNGDFITCPLMVDNQPRGLVAVELPAGTDAQRQAAAKALHWGAAWLELLLQAPTVADPAQLSAVVDVLATALEHDSCWEASSAAASELARHLGCERVSVGFRQRNNTRVLAVSRNASADNRTALLRAIGAAMDEAIDQDSSLVYPSKDQRSAKVLNAHAELSRAYGSSSICTVPISHDNRLIGALAFEHSEGGRFDGDQLAFCEAAVGLLGPILTGKRNEERWAGMRMLDLFKAQLAKLTGPRHVNFKLGAAMSVALALFLGFAEGEYRVSADAALEGKVQRVVTAPFDGYVLETLVRPGDLVAADQLLCSLEDRDLKLEELKWSSEKAKLQKEYREAMAAHEDSRVRIIQAQLEQANAQLELVAEQLTRTRVTAPLDGMIVKGDLTQSLGAPVERGDVLFEVAPLDDYRVMLAVDETDVGRTLPGLAGKLKLTGLQDEPMSFLVQRITPISAVIDGRNYFTVEARLLDEDTRLLRPGMKGVGKIYIGQRKLAWIWTHDMLDWLAMWSWGRGLT